MSGVEGQISIFTMLDGYDAPRLPYRDCRAGVVAWTIEYAAITNSLDWDAPVLYLRARPRKIIFKRDSREDQYGWSLFYESLGRQGDYFGGWGSQIDVFASRPSDADCERFAREKYKKDRRVTTQTPYRQWE